MSLPTVNEWADLMPHTVVIEPWTGYTGGGSGSTFGTGVSSSCRIQMKNHLVVAKDGKVITARGSVFLLSTSLPGVKDRVTLPAGYVPLQPPLIDVKSQDDESGLHHITLELQ